MVFFLRRETPQLSYYNFFLPYLYSTSSIRLRVAHYTDLATTSLYTDSAQEHTMYTRAHNVCIEFCRQHTAYDGGISI